MVRVPTMSCPGLHRMLTEAPADLLAGFLASKPFEKLEWLAPYQFQPDDAAGRDRAARMLTTESKLTLSPLETEAARIITIAASRGQFVLEGLIRDSSDPHLSPEFIKQTDELARSLWASLKHVHLFGAAENVLHLRLYRRYDRHYQTFRAAPAGDDGREPGLQAIAEFINDLEKGLQRGTGCKTDRFDVPADGDEAAAEMYLIRHPNLATAARDIDEGGTVSKFYFRPPGEAMVVYTPSTGRVHVRADSRMIRHLVAKTFVKTILRQEPSHQPDDFQAYDISRFLNDLDLSLPDDPEALIKKVAVIRLEASIGKLTERLAVSATLKEGVMGVIGSHPGLRDAFRNAAAVRFVEIAVQYRRMGRGADQTLDFTISDQNTCSLLSLDDPFERFLGHRLLRAWRIMVDGRAPAETDLRIVLPAVLALWNSGVDRVSGAWLTSRSLNAAPMIDLGFLVPMGWEEDTLLDDDDGIGGQEASVAVDPGSVELISSEGQAAPGGHREAYRLFRVREEWAAQYLREQIAAQFGSATVEVITPNLLALGTLRVSGSHVPVYLVRRLHDERHQAETDTAIRARSDLGIGLVLNAAKRPGFTLAANVLVSLSDYLSIDSSAPVINPEALRSAFLRHRNLAEGGESVELVVTGEHAGTLIVPGKGSIDIVGENRLTVINRLVEVHQSKGRPMKTEDMIKGMGRQSLANIFGKELWPKLKAGFLHSPKSGSWQIAVANSDSTPSGASD